MISFNTAIPVFGKISEYGNSSSSGIRVKQFDKSDCGIACLQSLHRFHGKEVSIMELRTIAGTDQSGTSVFNLIKTARVLGYNAKGLRLNANHLDVLKVPYIARIIPSQGPHFVVVYKVSRWMVKVMDPAIGKLYWIPKYRIRRFWSEVVISLDPVEEQESAKEEIRKNVSLMALLGISNEAVLTQGQSLHVFYVLILVGFMCLGYQVLDDANEMSNSVSFLVLFITDILHLVIQQAKRVKIKQKKVLLMRKLIKAIARLPKRLREGYSEGEYDTRMNDVFQFVGFSERLLIDLPWNLFLWLYLSLLLNLIDSRLLLLSFLVSMIILQTTGMKRLLSQSGETNENDQLRKGCYRLFYGSKLFHFDLFNHWKDFLKTACQAEKNQKNKSWLKTVYSILFVQIILLGLSLFGLSYFFQNLLLEPAVFLLMFFHFTKTQFLLQFLLQFKQFRISRNRLKEALNFRGSNVGNNGQNF